MKVEAWMFGLLLIFAVPVTVVYWFMSYDPTGTTALVLTSGFAALVTLYLGLTAKRMEPRPEDLHDAEIADGAGELGFFSPHSWWPLAAAASIGVIALGVVFGVWLALIGVGFGIVALCGLIFEYYLGSHSH